MPHPELSNPVLEIIATSVADAKAAEAGGADRIELVSAMAEGGLTPSYAMIEQVVASVSIPVYVMIRPHSRSFRYDSDDVRVMLEDIRVCRQLGAAGIVAGGLTDDGHIDEPRLRDWIEAADGMGVTFHRAFDESANLPLALEAISRFPQVRRILTSGGKNSAPEAIPELKRLSELSATTHVSIMAGAGLTIENLRGVVKRCRIREVHIGSGVRHRSSFQFPADPELVAKAKQALIEAAGQV
ncbi:copper homeostasis protein CutC [Paenibacillus alkalitolerans]|uniref:copper homeostasis protein CutC n=1 Tax=Paenibacillus alkalitolerans TaxID=2799335 RepID=UPI001F2D0A7B|nr:copper homeostasis protein CutC [Paenibacillus alkalitolerans]